MGVHQSFASSLLQNFSPSELPHVSKSKSLSYSVKSHLQGRTKLINQLTISNNTSMHLPKCSISETIPTGNDNSTKPTFNYPDIDEKLLQELVDHALVWSSLHGLVVGDKNQHRSSTVPGVGIVHAPITLLPTQFPETHWKQACDLAPIFNELIDRVSLDSKFLHQSLSRTKKGDTFTSKLLDIHSKVCHRREKLRLGLHRSDYMVDKQTGSLLQVEFNTISSSFCGLSTHVNELHRNLVDQYEQRLMLDSESVPINNPVTGFSHALAKAWGEYGNKRAVILFIVQKHENNMYDQYWLSSELRENHGIKSIRKTLADVDSEGMLLEDGTLLIGDDLVSVIYFRAAYTPSDYPSESEWRARLLLERSSAIKCPSISYQLAGTKKIQQELAKPGALEMFMEKKDDIAKLRRCFAGLWSLDDSDAVKKAISQPELFVIKPQREGGGNNIYGDEVRKTLEAIENRGEDNAAYILMQRIFPNVFPTYFIRHGVCQRNSSVSELGIYSAYLRRNEDVIVNDQCGYLMRTKFSSSNEGGVAAGFAVLDSIYLT